MDISVGAMLLGTPGTLAYEELKKIWGNYTSKSLSEVYVYSFHKAINENQDRLLSKSDSEDKIYFSEEGLRNSLATKLEVDPNELPYLRIRSERYIQQLAEALVFNDVLTIGGSTLSKDDTISIVRDVVKYAHEVFLIEVQKNPHAFNKVLFNVLEDNQSQISDFFASFADSIGNHLQRIHNNLTDIFNIFVTHDGFYSFEDWEQDPLLRTDLTFEIDASRQTFIDELGIYSNAERSTKYIRIEGLSGLGKTRLVYEAVKRNSLGYATFYAQSPQDIPNNWFTYISQNPNDTKIILIVDETTYDETIELLQKARRCKGRVLCITIGTDMPQYTGMVEAGVYSYGIKQLDNSSIQRILEDRTPTLSWEIHQHIIRLSNGRIKLALAAVEALEQHQNSISSTSELMQAHGVKWLLDALVPDETQRRAMQALSLLTVIGVEAERSNEMEVISTFLGIKIADLRDSERKLRKQGFVVKRGRFRLVSPTLLATWFAQEVWDTWQGDMINLWKQLPETGAKVRLLSRLSDIGDERYASQFVEVIFGSHGAIDTLHALNDESASYHFLLLSRSAPVASIGVLERMVRTASLDLQNFKSGRRNIIYALEEMLKLEAISIRSARILQKFAAAENETWGNNATKIWSEIFYLRIPRNPITGEQRLHLIRTVMQGNKQDHLTALIAIEKILNDYGMVASGAPQGGYLPSAPWLPVTWEEIWDIRHSAIQLLETLLNSIDEEIAEKAFRILIETARMQLRGLTDEVFSLLRRVTHSEDRKLHLRQLLQDIHELDENYLSDTQKQDILKWLEELEGTTYQERLHRFVGKLTQSDKDNINDDKLDYRGQLLKLCQEGSESPDLIEAELDWLTSHEAENAFQFGKNLAELDSERKWLTVLLDKHYYENPMLFVGYLVMMRENNQQTFVDDLLRQWTQNSQQHVNLIYQVVRAIGGTDYYVDLLIELTKKNWLTLPQLNFVMFRRWLDNVSEQGLERLITTIADEFIPGHTFIGLDIFHSWLHLHPSKRSLLPTVGLRLIKMVIRDEGRFSERHRWYDWKIIAQLLASQFPLEITHATLALFDRNIIHMNAPTDYRIEVLCDALKADEANVWDLIGDTLLSSYWLRAELKMDFRHNGKSGSSTLLEQVSAERLLAWVDKDASVRAQLIGTLLDVDHDPLPPLPRALLINYGDSEEVRRSLNPLIRSMVWSGSYSGKLRGTLELAQKWMKDDHISVQMWAQEIIIGLQERIRQEESREAEDDLFW